jgi:hypothetical protein
MVDEASRRSLEEIRRTVEASLQPSGNGGSRIETVPLDPSEHVTDPAERVRRQQNVSGTSADEPNGSGNFAAAERIEKIGHASARAIMEACETTASDIERTAQLAVDAAATIMKEATELAGGLRAKGDQMVEHLKEFADLAKRVSITMRDARNEVISD